MSAPGGAAVLRLTGDVDFFTEDEFRERAEQLLGAGTPTGLVVDLAEVNFIDSSGLGLLVDLFQLCRDLEMPMRLRNVPDRITELLDVTGLNQMIALE